MWSLNNLDQFQIKMFVFYNEGVSKLDWVHPASICVTTPHIVCEVLGFLHTFVLSKSVFLGCLQLIF